MSSSGGPREYGYRVDAKQYAVEIDLGPNCEWVAEMQWPDGQTQGGPAVLVVHPASPGGDNTAAPAGGISHTLLREIDFRSALDALRRGLDSSKKWADNREVGDERVRALLGKHAALGKVTDTYLALLARVYVSAVSSGQAKPLEHLAETTGKTPAAIKNHLWQATRKGLLERSPGRPGGHLTERAVAILEELIPSGLEPPAKTAKRLRGSVRRTRTNT